MGEFVITLFIFVTVITISLALFTGWATVMTAKGIGRLMGMLLFGSNLPASQTRRCAQCRKVNPSAARYCRRCGKGIGGGLFD